MVVAALASPVIPELAVLVALIVIVVSAWKLGAAFLLGRGVMGTAEGEITVRRVRFEHRMRSRGYLEVERDGHRQWWPVYFHTGLLGFAPDASAQMSPVRVGRAAFLIEPGVLAVPSGRRTSTQPAGTLLDAPRLNPTDLRTRSARFGSLRRRIVLDAPAAVAGPVIGVLWVLASGGGIVEFIATTVLASTAAVWSSAISGSDPS